MAARLQEIAWVVSMLDYCPDVEVLDLRVSAGDVETGQRVLVDVVEVAIQVKDWCQADALAASLRLTEGSGRVNESRYGRLEWRTWTGWVPEGSEQLPVWVSVTAGETVPLAVSADPFPAVVLGSVVA